MEKNEVMKPKKRLNILEIAATDKENLSSQINRKKMNLNTTKSLGVKKVKLNNDLDNKSSTQIKNIINKNKKDQSTQSTSIIESDLTVDNPSEDYWQKMAESCRKALDTALKENVDLHNKVNELEYENSRLKVMLEEAKSLVEVLTEMVEEKEEEPGETSKDCSGLEESKNASDSDVEDMSFQSSA